MALGSIMIFKRFKSLDSAMKRAKDDKIEARRTS